MFSSYWEYSCCMCQCSCIRRASHVHGAAAWWLSWVFLCLRCASGREGHSSVQSCVWCWVCSAFQLQGHELSVAGFCGRGALEQPSPGSVVWFCFQAPCGTPVLAGDVSAGEVHLSCGISWILTAEA